jgi:hypothetical protein
MNTRTSLIEPLKMENVTIDHISFNPELSSDRKAALGGRLYAYAHHYAWTGIKKKELPFNKTLIPNWAMIWNKANRMHETCKLLCTDGTFCIVEFKDGSDVYRTEDIDVLNEKISKPALA